MSLPFLPRRYRGTVAAAAPITPPPATNLIGWYIAGTGVTASGGLISQWADQSGAGNHLAQATGSLQPTDTVDAAGTPIVRIPRVDSTTAVRTMSTAAGALSTQTCSLWLIARQANQAGHDLIFINGTATATLRLFGSNSLAPSIYAGSKSSVLKFGMNRSLAGCVNNGATNTTIYNGYKSSVAAAVTLQSGTGFKLGPTAADIYEVLIYNGTQSAPDAAAVRAYAVAKYGVRSTDYTKRLVFLGDSITAGSTSTDQQSYPFILANDPTLAAWEMFNQGTSGQTIAGITTIAGSTDAYFDGTIGRNVLVLQIGRNDAGGSGHAGAVIYSDMVTYCQARVAAGWEVWVCTCIATVNSSIQTELAIFNGLLRGAGGGGSGNGIVTDAGVNRVVDLAANAAFDSSADAALFVNYSDGTHCNNTGNALMGSLVKAAGL